MEMYETSDLQTASFLYGTGHKLDCIDRTTNRAVFCFKRQKGTDFLLESFHRRHEFVEPNSYFESIKYLKNRLYNG